MGTQMGQNRWPDLELTLEVEVKQRRKRKGRTPVVASTGCKHLGGC